MPEIDVKQKVLAANQAAAAALRESFRDQRTLVVNLISSPGSGKTTLLEATVARLSIYGLQRCFPTSKWEAARTGLEDRESTGEPCGSPAQAAKLSSVVMMTMLAKDDPQ